MNRITTIGVIIAILGIIAQFVDCPYGVYIIVAGAIVALLGFFMRPRNTATGV